MKTYRSFVITVLSLIILIMGSSAGFIYFMDPMWTFNHSHKYNDVQTVIDERQQKTNTIHFLPFHYDTLLLGSSRTTYINQYDFEGMNVYNFAASNLSPTEYNSFIEYAKKERGKEFERIIIGLDFFKTSIQESSVKKSLDKYITEMNKPLYRYRNLISYDLLQYSIQNFKMSYHDKVVEERDYNRENVASARVEDPDVIKEQTEAKIEKFRSVFYGKHYVYNPNYKSILKELVENNPHTEFIVFTTPISTPLFEAMIESGQLDDYEKWLADVVDVFGGVYNFMYPNTITNNLSNYFDGHHFYPKVGTIIAKKLSDVQNGVPHDFGQYVTNENLDSHLAMVEGLSTKMVAKK